MHGSRKLTDRPDPWTVFLIFLRLGLTSFGGPIAHLGYFHQEFVARRRWLSERSYADLVALCQFLPGPASSQVGIALGLSRAGYAGAVAAWVGFTLPSAIFLIFFASSLSGYGGLIPTGALQGLKIAAVAVVAQAVWAMARALCPDRSRITMMAIAACIALLLPSAWGQIGIIAATGFFGLMMLKPDQHIGYDLLPVSISRRSGAFCLAIFFSLLAVLPILTHLAQTDVLVMIDAFFRAGSMVFGGGHVVLPLLQAQVASPGWISNETFLAGYGAAQAVPGPLFTFAAFLGASMSTTPAGWIMGFICLLAIFAPSFLLVIGVLPFWEQLRHNGRIRAALMGVNAGVVGLLVAALYQPVWTSAIYQRSDFGLALLALVALIFWKLPPWLVVVGSGVAGWLLSIAS